MRTIILLIIFIKIALSVGEDEYFCECIPLEECSGLALEMKNKNIYQNKPDYICDNELVCCAIERKNTVSENKCSEFAKLCPLEGLIFNGIKTKPHEFPFMASVQIKYKTENASRWICGGSLIDKNYVLTAAHCLDNLMIDNHTLKDNIEMSVVMGIHKKSDLNTRIKVVNVTIHPDFGWNDSFADLALLKLQSEVNFTDKIKPICLTEEYDCESEHLTAAGWGPFNGRDFPDQLLKTTLKRVLSDSCPADEELYDKDRRFCAIPSGKSGDVCHSDSGGPIFTRDPDRSDCIFALWGVVAEGGLCDRPGPYTFHTKVSYYRKWIEGVVWPQ